MAIFNAVGHGGISLSLQLSENELDVKTHVGGFLRTLVAIKVKFHTFDPNNLPHPIHPAPLPDYGCPNIIQTFTLSTI